MEKKVKYLGGGWVDTTPLSKFYRLTVGKEYRLIRVDSEGDYWVFSDISTDFEICLKSIFFEDVDDTPEDNHTFRYYVIMTNPNHIVLYKTDLLTLAIDYRDKNGGIITEVLS